VVDVAELCRNTHTHRDWVRAAEQACVRLHATVADLNGRSGLYRALCDAQEACAQGRAPPLSAEGASVAASLRGEFERGGVHLPAPAREALQAAQAQAVAAGHALSRQLSSPGGLRWLSSDVPAPAEAQGVMLRARAGRHHLSGRGVGRTQPGDSSPLLALLQARARIAQLLGYRSYAALATAPLFARSPEAPSRFCAQLAQALGGPAREEAAHAAALAGRSVPAGGGVDPGASLRASLCSLGDMQAASRFFTVHSCVAGLCSVSERLFGVTLVETPLLPGEAWAPGLVKLAARHADEGPLGVVYLDLHPRPGKHLPGAAHFVIRAGRSRGQGAGASVALVASLGSGEGGALPHSGVVLLHHEWGHALHSLLSRTRYQHLSGTRGPVDCVEAPSTLVERLAWTQGALDLWARSSQDAPLPPQLLHRLRAARTACGASDALQQVVQATADLALHGAQSPDHVDAAFVAACLDDATAQHGQRGHGQRGHWMRSFGHVVGYGAVYYAYLYGTALSGSAWRVLGLDAQPLSRSAGQQLWAHLLRPGGTAPPAHALAALLGPQALASLAGDGVPDAPSVALAVKDILDGP
jgi:intermediate peptidase